MKNAARKIKLMILMFFVFIFVSSSTIEVYAIGSYTINGVTVKYTDFSSSPNECWVYANNIYKKIWGVNFTNLFSSSDNMLRNLSDGELTLTIDHLKSYVSNAALGSCLRICNIEYLHGSDGWGHSQVIVQKDANGFAVLEGGLSAAPYCREKYYTWSEYCNTGWLGGTYRYIKYIKWPGASAYSSNRDTTAPTISNVRVTDISSTGYTVTCTVTDNVGVTSVKFPTWPAADGSWNPIWHEGSISGSTASCRINVSDHGGITGTNYATHIYAYDAAGNSSSAATDWVSIPAPDKVAPKITNVRISDVSTLGYTVHCTVWDNDTIAKVNYVTWTPDVGGFDDKKEQAISSGFSGKGQSTTLSFKVYTKDHNNEKGRYATHIYAYDKAGNCTGVLTNAAIGGKYWKPTATTTYNGHTYELYDTWYWNWTTAKTYCDSVGGYLVCITSAGEQKAVEELISKGKKEGYWFGATDQYVEGQWTWVTGETMNYTHWSPNQPDNWENNEHYGEIIGSSKNWNDVPEDVRNANGDGIYGFICEYNSASTTVNTKKNQIISANNFSKTYGDVTFSIGATTSGNGSLSYSSSNTSVVSVSNNGTVTIKGVGKASITITAASTSTYNKATKTITITVNKKKQTISAKCFIKKVGDSAFSIGAKTSGNGKLTYSSDKTSVATVSMSGKVTIKGVGIAKITITAASTSTCNKTIKTITVTVNPKSTTLSSLKNSSSKKLKITWKRNSAVTGYRIQIATNSKFTNAKIYTIKSNKTLTKTISVTKGKTYYVRIRTYKGSLQSSWSAVKKLKIKK